MNSHLTEELLSIETARQLVKFRPMKMTCKTSTNKVASIHDVSLQSSTSNFLYRKTQATTQKHLKSQIRNAS